MKNRQALQNDLGREDIEKKFNNFEENLIDLINAQINKCIEKNETPSKELLSAIETLVFVHYPYLFH